MRIAIVDDEQLIREGLKIIFSSYDDIEVVATGSDGNEAVEICKEHKPDLVLLDIRMPNCNGVDATKKIKQLDFDTKILILTTFTDSEYIQTAIQNGASGYLLKDSSPELIYDGIKAAVSGNMVINPDLAQNIFQNNQPKEKTDVSEIMEKYDLSQKELELIRLVAEGLSNKEIAHKQHLSEGTIKNYISNIFLKLFVSDRTQLAIFAYKNGISEK